jgi:transposase
MLTPGQCLDMKAFVGLWENGDWHNVNYVVADKGYDTAAIRISIREAAKIPIIPRRRGAICPGVQDKIRYRTRSAIERFFGRLKENKRLALRFDKLDSSFYAFFIVATIKIFNLFC